MRNWLLIDETEPRVSGGPQYDSASWGHRTVLFDERRTQEIHVFQGVAINVHSKSSIWTDP